MTDGRSILIYRIRSVSLIFFFSCRLKRSISCPPHTESFYSMIILRRTYLGGIKFVSTLSPRPKKMMGELAMSLVKKDVSNFMSK